MADVEIRKVEDPGVTGLWDVLVNGNHVASLEQHRYGHWLVSFGPSLSAERVFGTDVAARKWIVANAEDLEYKEE